jgi:hypothetical protein
MADQMGILRAELLKPAYDDKTTDEVLAILRGAGDDTTRPIPGGELLRLLSPDLTALESSADDKIKYLLRIIGHPDFQLDISIAPDAAAVAALPSAPKVRVTAAATVGQTLAESLGLGRVKAGHIEEARRLNDGN